MWRKFRGWAWSFLALTLMSATAASQVPTEGAAPTAEPALIAAPTTPQLTSTDVDAWLDGFMPNTLANADIAGAVVTVVRDGQVIANRGYGYSNLETRTPVDPNVTLFRPGSISKLFTWTAVMQQVEAGNIDLDADINTYIDFEIPAYDGQPITMRQVMTHTTGFEEAIRDLIVSDQAAALMTIGDYLKTHIPARIYPPGTMPAYSNYATTLAGYVVERVSGEPFNDYLQAHIFDPLGMRNSTFAQPLPEAMQGAMSGGYKNVADGEAQFFEIVVPSPAGALTTTGADMALFMNAHLNNGAGLMSPETAREMHETVDQQFPGVNSMVLGFYHEHYSGQRIIAHGGDTNWFHSNLSLLMDQNVGVFISVNSGGAENLGAQLLRWSFMEAFVDRYYPAAEAPAELVALETAREHGAAVVGDYDSSRRSQMSPLLAVYFAGQTTVAMLPNGDLVGPGLPDVNGQPKHWREVEPWVWQAVGGDERMGARVDENGRVTAIAFEPLSFAIAATRAPWYRTKSLLLPLLGAALGVLLLTLLSWPVRALARRVHQTAFPYEGGRALAHRLGAGAALLTAVYIGAWVGFVAWLIGSATTAGGGAGGILTVLYVSGVLVLLALAAAAYANFSLWRAPSTWFAKIWGVLLLLSVLVVIWFAAVMNFFSFTYSY